uniref:Uncharacterized protein n=1 Tax=Anguilla anguilla TaxID=7936 RepID=A0A0E9W1A5_ANGAN
MVFMGGHHRGNNCPPIKHCCTSKVCKSPPGCSWGQCSMDR